MAFFNSPLTFFHLCLLSLACLSAGIGGFIGVSLASAYYAQRRRGQYLQPVLTTSDEIEDDIHQTITSVLPLKVTTMLIQQSRILALKPPKYQFTKGVWVFGTRELPDQIRKAGLASQISVEAYCHTRVLIGLIGFCGGALLGCVFSIELALVLGTLAAFVGFGLPQWTLKQVLELRKNAIEMHLSEMLEVVALGLRSGLSFDQSFELYHQHFTTSLARSCVSVQRQWQLGLKTREEALREFAASYDSILFNRVIENIIRSLRFGSSLAESLEASAAEARMINKSNRQEKVAKAPVKMLVPTAALILPAMLLFVLGPVLLELLTGL